MLNKKIMLEIINNRIFTVLNEISDSIRAIYGCTVDDHPYHIGTCILLCVNGTKYLLTAAHVIDENKHSTLYVEGKNAQVEILGDFQRTSICEQDREKDAYDFAWLKLTSKSIKELGSVPYISENMIFKNWKYANNKALLALGYPNSKNKNIDKKRKIIRKSLFKYLGKVKKNKYLFKKFDITGDEHILIDYKTSAKRFDGVKVNSIKPTGMSGGALIDIVSGKLVGILTSYHKHVSVIMATNINFVIEQMIKNKNLE